MKSTRKKEKMKKKEILDFEINFHTTNKHTNTLFSLQYFLKLFYDRELKMTTKIQSIYPGVILTHTHTTDFFSVIIKLDT